RVAPAFGVRGVGEDLLEVAAGAAVRLDGEAPLRKELEDLGLRGGEPARTARTVDVHLERKEAERPRGGDGGIELPEASGRRVARVGEGRLAGLRAALVELAETGDRHVDLAADLEAPGRRVGAEPQERKSVGEGSRGECEARWGS